MIKINEKYFIDSDSHCFVLKEYKGKFVDKKTNEEKDNYVDLGYYSDPATALKGFLKRELKEFISKDEINSLKELSEKIDELQKYFEKHLSLIK